MNTNIFGNLQIYKSTTAFYTMFAVEHLLSSGQFGSVSTIPSMVFRSCLNNSLIVGSNDRAHISAATITQLYRIFMKDF